MCLVRVYYLYYWLLPFSETNFLFLRRASLQIPSPNTRTITLTSWCVWCRHQDPSPNTCTITLTSWWRHQSVQYYFFPRFLYVVEFSLWQLWNSRYLSGVAIWSGACRHHHGQLIWQAVHHTTQLAHGGFNGVTDSFWLLAFGLYTIIFKTTCIQFMPAIMSMGLNP
jgi:hypothetical protein